MRYLTYDEAGNVTGAFIQDLHPVHASRHIEATQEQYRNWTSLRVVNGALETKPPAPPAPLPIPQEVTMRQARQQLRIDGKIGQVNAALNSMTGIEGELARDEWEYSTVVQRNRPLVIQLGAALGLNLDELFTKASKLP